MPSDLAHFELMEIPQSGSEVEFVHFIHLHYPQHVQSFSGRSLDSVSSQLQANSKTDSRLKLCVLRPAREPSRAVRGADKTSEGIENTQNFWRSRRASANWSTGVEVSVLCTPVEVPTVHVSVRTSSSMSVPCLWLRVQ